MRRTLGMSGLLVASLRRSGYCCRSLYTNAFRCYSPSQCVSTTGPAAGRVSRVDKRVERRGMLEYTQKYIMSNAAGKGARMSKSQQWDVIVVGAGNAALCAAISARESGASVLVLEKAGVDERGGNSLFTAGGFRFVHDGVDDLQKDVLVDLSKAEVDQIVIPPLSKDTYLDDLRRVTEGQTDDTLAELLVGNSRETVVWMRANGVRFIPMFGRQSFKVDGKHHFYGGVNIEAVGGGWGLVDSLIKRAERVGVEIRYSTALRELLQDRSGAVSGVRVMGPDGYEELAARSVVLACGGFEANPEMRVRYYGAGWESCRVRGSRHNTGDGIQAALDIDAQAFGG